MLPRHASHVDESIAHSSERRVYADIGLFGNLLERLVLEEFHINHLSLCLRQVVHEFHCIVESLFVHNAFLLADVNNILPLQGAEVVVLIDIRKENLVLAVIVNNGVACYRGNPELEISLAGIAVFP